MTKLWHTERRFDIAKAALWLAVLSLPGPGYSAPMPSSNSVSTVMVKDFHVSDMPRRTALAKLLKLTGKNFAVSQDIIGSVTLDIESPISLTMAVKAVMAGTDQAWEFDIHDGMVVVSAQPETAAVKRRKLLAQPPIGYERNSRLYKLPIDHSDAKALLERLEPGGDAAGLGVPPYLQMTALEADNTLLVKATPEDFQRVREIVKDVDVVVRQAQLQVKQVAFTDAQMEAHGLHSLTLGATPKLGDTKKLTDLLIAGKLAVTAAPSMTVSNGATAFTMIPSGQDQPPLKVTLTTTIHANDTLRIHIIVSRKDSEGETKQFETTLTVASGATLFAGMAPEPALSNGERHLIFVSGQVMPDPEDAEQANVVP